MARLEAVCSILPHDAKETSHLFYGVTKTMTLKFEGMFRQMIKSFILQIIFCTVITKTS